MKGVGCACTRPTVPPEQKHGGEGPLVLPLGRERPARAEVSSKLGAGEILTAFYSSLYQVSKTKTFFGPNQSVEFTYQRSAKTSLFAGYFSGIHAAGRSEEPQLRMSSSLFFILPALGGYALVSQYLLKNPLILHKKKRPGFYCTRISHRGGKSERGAPLWPGTGGTRPSKAAAGWSDSVPLCSETPAPETTA